MATVAHAALLRHTDAAREQIQAITEDRAADALTVVSAAEKAYWDVGERARRLSGTTTVSRINAVLHSPLRDSNHPGHAPCRRPRKHRNQINAGAGELGHRSLCQRSSSVSNLCATAGRAQ